MAGLKITKPDGTIVEVDKSAISAIPKDVLLSLLTGTPTTAEDNEPEVEMKTMDDFINGSKIDKFAFFLVSQYSQGMTLTTQDIHKDWTQFIAKDNYDLMIGKSNLAQYLTRMSERGLLTKNKKKGKQITWTLERQLYLEYQSLEISEIQIHLSQEIR